MTATFESHPPVSAEERYASAMKSSHLRVEAETRGDADQLIASAWSAMPGGQGAENLPRSATALRHALAAQLYRLRVEFDAVKASTKMGMGPGDYVLALNNMCSLRATRQALGLWADNLATRRHFMASPAVVAKLAGRALDAFLDPTCPHCQGRTFTGGNGAPAIPCRPCGQTGKKRIPAGMGADEVAFTALLRAEMEAMTDAFDSERKRRLREY